ncbi:MAG: flagellar hook-associated protein FlgK [Rhodocyclaceae bacterium]|nr:flagellar hook-associated protein FlgK [Rhodocyclaceae bacterium]
MGSSLLNIAVTGLNAAQANLQTTSHNIANASTPGFNRQSAVQSTQTPELTGSGFFGQGTDVTTVVRAYNKFMSDQVASTQAQSSQLQTYSDQIAQIENLMSDPTVGLTPGITGFFDGVNAVAADPSSAAARQSMLSSAQSLVARFQDMDQQLAQVNGGVNSQIVSETTTINSLAGQIAAMNQSIATTEAAGPGQQANDLRDQRDQLVAQLNSHISTSIVSQSDGSYSVFIGNGQPLVVGTASFKLSAASSTNDPAQTTVNLISPTGQSSQIPENLLSGGALGGLLQFRSETLNDARNALGQIAVVLADTFNTQHRLGQDLTGAMGGDFFKMPTPVVVPDANNPPPAAGPGTVSATISDASALTTSDYLLTAGSQGVSLTRLSDNTVVASGTKLPITVDGMTINVSGALAPGESFKIEPTKYAARDLSVAITDVRSIAAGVPVTASSGVANTGTTQISGGALVAPVTLTYSSSLQGYTGFPAGATLSIWNGTTTTTQTVSSSSQAVAIPAGANVSVNGITFQVTGAPANGDTFTIGPNQLQAGSANTGPATISAGGRIAATTLTYSAAANGFSITPTPSPLLGTTVSASVTNAGVTTTTQYPIRLATDTIPYIAGATYQYNGISFSLGGAAPADGDTFTIGASTVASAGGANAGAGTISALPTSSGSALGSASLAYNGGNLTGFPAGTVKVTANGLTNTFNVAGPATTIPFVAGATYSFSGAAVVFGAGIPADGDTFSVAQLPSTTSATATIGETPTAFSASLPTSPYTLSYDSQSNLLTGFPPGATVAVTTNGVTTEVPITAPNTGVSFTSGMQLMVNGVSMTLTGTPQNGDTFVIAPTASGTTDNRNMQLLGALQTMKTMLGGTASYEDSYAQLVSTVGNKGNQVNVMNKAQQAQLTQAQNNQQSFSGVNLDEEAANLIRYQQQYQAAAKIISIASKLFDLLTGL